MATPSPSTRLTTEPAGPNDPDLVRTPGAPDSAAPAPDRPSTDTPPSLRSVLTANFSPILQALATLGKQIPIGVHCTDSQRRLSPK